MIVIFSCLRSHLVSCRNSLRHPCQRWLVSFGHFSLSYIVIWVMSQRFFKGLCCCRLIESVLIVDLWKIIIEMVFFFSKNVTENCIYEMSYNSQVFVSYVILKCLDLAMREVFIVKVLQFVIIVSICGFKQLFLERQNFLSEFGHISIDKTYYWIPGIEIVINRLFLKNANEKAKHSSCPKSIFLRFFDSFDLNEEIKV